MMSPVSPPPLSSDPRDRGSHTNTEMAEDDVDLSKAMLDDIIVGVEQVILPELGPGVKSEMLSGGGVGARHDNIFDLSQTPRRREACPDENQPRHTRMTRNYYGPNMQHQG